MIDEPNYQAELEKLYPTGWYGGQCGIFAHRLMQFPPIGDSLQEKIDAVTQFGVLDGALPDGPEVGDVIITRENKIYGHVCFVNGKNGNTLTLTESNYHLDLKITHTRKMDAHDPMIVGVFRGPLLFGTRPMPPQHTMKVLVINGTQVPEPALQDQLAAIRTTVEKYSQKSLTIEWDRVVNEAVNVQTGDLSESTAYALADKYGAGFRFIMITYSSPTAAFLTTFSTGDGLTEISTIPNTQPPRSIAFEFSHAITKYYNSARPKNDPQYPYIEDTDSNFPSDEFIVAKFYALMPYLDLVTGSAPQPTAGQDGQNTMGKLVTVDGKRIWNVIGNFRFWVLDPETEQVGLGKAFAGPAETITQDQLNQYQYGGAMFISNTDDPNNA